MGTRADFYVGKGKDAEWIGSIAWDGYREGIEDAVLMADTEQGFRAAVARFFVDRDDVTLPARGWPWPWDNSAITDCSYWFFDGCVWDDCRKRYRRCDTPLPDDYSHDDPLPATMDGGTIEYPDMSTRKNVRFDGGSGLMIIRAAHDAKAGKP